MLDALFWSYARSAQVLQYVKDTGMSMHELDPDTTAYDLYAAAEKAQAALGRVCDPSRSRDWVDALASIMTEAHMAHLDDTAEFRRDMVDVYNKLAQNILGDGSYASKIYDTVFATLRDEFPTRQVEDLSMYACWAVTEKLNWDIPEAKYGDKPEGAGSVPEAPPMKMMKPLVVNNPKGPKDIPQRAPAGLLAGIRQGITLKSIAGSNPPEAAAAAQAGTGPSGPVAVQGGPATGPVAAQGGGPAAVARAVNPSTGTGGPVVTQGGPVVNPPTGTGGPVVVQGGLAATGPVAVQGGPAAIAQAVNPPTGTGGPVVAQGGPATGPVAVQGGPAAIAQAVNPSAGSGVPEAPPMKLGPPGGQKLTGRAGLLAGIQTGIKLKSTGGPKPSAAAAAAAAAQAVNPSAGTGAVVAATAPVNMVWVYDPATKGFEQKPEDAAAGIAQTPYASLPDAIKENLKGVKSYNEWLQYIEKLPQDKRNYEIAAVHEPKLEIEISPGNSATGQFPSVKESTLGRKTFSFSRYFYETNEDMVKAVDNAVKVNGQPFITFDKFIGLKGKPVDNVVEELNLLLLGRDKNDMTVLQFDVPPVQTVLTNPSPPVPMAPLQDSPLTVQVAEGITADAQYMASIPQEEIDRRREFHDQYEPILKLDLSSPYHSGTELVFKPQVVTRDPSKNPIPDDPTAPVSKSVVAAFMTPGECIADKATEACIYAEIQLLKASWIFKHIVPLMYLMFLRSMLVRKSDTAKPPTPSMADALKDTYDILDTEYDAYRRYELAQQSDLAINDIKVASYVLSFMLLKYATTNATTAFAKKSESQSADYIPLSDYITNDLIKSPSGIIVELQNAAELVYAFGSKIIGKQFDRPQTLGDYMYMQLLNTNMTKKVEATDKNAGGGNAPPTEGALRNAEIMAAASKMRSKSSLSTSANNNLPLLLSALVPQTFRKWTSIDMLVALLADAFVNGKKYTFNDPITDPLNKKSKMPEDMTLLFKDVLEDNRDVSMRSIMKIAEHMRMSDQDLADLVKRRYDDEEFASEYRADSTDANIRTMRMELCLHDAMIITSDEFVKTAKKVISMLAEIPESDRLTIYDLYKVGTVDDSMVRKFFYEHPEHVDIRPELLIEETIAVEQCSTDVDPLFKELDRLDMVIALQWLYGKHHINQGLAIQLVQKDSSDKTPLAESYQDYVKKDIVSKFYRQRMRDLFPPMETAEELQKLQQSVQGKRMGYKLDSMILFDVISHAGRIPNSLAVNGTADELRADVTKSLDEVVTYTNTLIMHMGNIESLSRATEDSVWMTYIEKNKKPVNESLKDYIKKAIIGCNDMVRRMDATYMMSLVRSRKISVVESNDVETHADKPVMQLMAHLKINVIAPGSKPMVEVSEANASSKKWTEAIVSTKKALPDLTEEQATESRQREVLLYMMRNIHRVPLNKLADPESYVRLFKNVRFLLNKHAETSSKPTLDEAIKLAFLYLCYPLARQMKLMNKTWDKVKIAAELGKVTLYTNLQNGPNAFMPFTAAGDNASAVLAFSIIAENFGSFESSIDGAIKNDLATQGITAYSEAGDYSRPSYINYLSKVVDQNSTEAFANDTTSFAAQFFKIYASLRLIWLFAPCMVLAMRKAVGPTPITASESANIDAVKNLFITAIKTLGAYTPADYNVPADKTVMQTAAAAGFPYVPYCFHGPCKEDVNKGLLTSREWCYVIMKSIVSMDVLPRLLFGPRWYDAEALLKWPQIFDISNKPVFAYIYLIIDENAVARGDPGPFRTAATKVVEENNKERPTFVQYVTALIDDFTMYYGMSKTQSINIPALLYEDFGMLESYNGSVKTLKETAMGVYNRLLTGNYGAPWTESEVADKVNGVWNHRTAPRESNISPEGPLYYMEAQMLHELDSSSFDNNKFPANWLQYRQSLNKLTPKYDRSSKTTYFDVLDTYVSNMNNWDEDHPIDQNITALSADIPSEWQWEVGPAAGLLQLEADYTEAAVTPGPQGGGIIVPRPCEVITDPLAPKKTCAPNASEKAMVVQDLRDKLAHVDVWEEKIRDLLRTGNMDEDTPVVFADANESRMTAALAFRNIIEGQKPDDPLLTTTVASKKAFMDMWDKFEKYFVEEGWKTAVRFVQTFRSDFAYDSRYVSLLYDRYQQRNENQNLWKPVAKMYESMSETPLKRDLIALHTKMLKILYTLMDIVNCAVITNERAMPATEVELQRNSLPRLRRWFALRRAFEQQPPKFYEQFNLPPLPDREDPHYYDVLDSLVMTYLYNVAQPNIEIGEALAKMKAAEEAKQAAEAANNPMARKPAPVTPP